jgi:hypothetical protein
VKIRNTVTVDKDIKFLHREDVSGGYRNLHPRELHNFYYSIHNIRLIKSWKMRWMKHLAHMEDTMNTEKVFATIHCSV